MQRCKLVQRTEDQSGSTIVAEKGVPFATAIIRMQCVLQMIFVGRVVTGRAVR